MKTDILMGAEQQLDEGTPTLLGASEPKSSIFGGDNITKFFKSAADIGANIAGIYSAFKNPSQSTGIQPVITGIVPTTAPVKANTSWFEKNKTLVIAGAGALLLLVVAIFAFRRGK